MYIRNLLRYIVPYQYMSLPDYHDYFCHACCFYISIPTYSEIVGSSDESEDERAIDEQEDFERRYNFRFEEPDSEFVCTMYTL